MRVLTKILVTASLITCINAIAAVDSISPELDRFLDRICNKFDSIPIALGEADSAKTYLQFIATDGPSNNYTNPSEIRKNTNVAATPMLSLASPIAKILDRVSLSAAAWLGVIGFDGIVSDRFQFRFFSLGGSLISTFHTDLIDISLSSSWQRNQSRMRGNFVIQEEDSGLDENTIIQTLALNLKTKESSLFTEFGLIGKETNRLFNISKTGDLFRSIKSSGMGINRWKQNFIQIGYNLEKWTIIAGKVSYTDAPGYYRLALTRVLL